MAMTFVGASSQYIQSVSNFSPGSAGTICFWMTPSSVTGTHNMMGIGNSYRIRQINTTLTVQLHTNSALVSTLFITAGIQYHITCTYTTGDVLTLYVNGVLNSTRSTGNSTPAAAPFRIGTTNTTPRTYWSGVIEDVRIYSRVLTGDEAFSIYASEGSDTMYDGILNRWLLNDGSSGSTVSGIGSVKDYIDIGFRFSPAAGAAAPLYSESLLRTRKAVLL